MDIIIFIFALIFVYGLIFRKYKNPYKLYMIFGKKGSGKSSYLVKLAIKYQKKGYAVYTNMSDCCLDGIRIIDIDDIGKFVPQQNSVLLLDEVGMTYDNRQFKNFKPETRDFYKLQRHYKVICYLASQNYDVDKKLRDLTDSMFLCQNIGIVWGLVRPISKRITLTEATAEGESRITENLKFQFITSWKFTYIPKYAKYFESFKVPEMPLLSYHEPDNPLKAKQKRKFHFLKLSKK